MRRNSAGNNNNERLLVPHTEKHKVDTDLLTPVS